MSGKIDERLQEKVQSLEKREEELKKELMEVTAKKNTLESILKLDDPGERILKILFTPEEVIIHPEKTAALANEKPYADMTLGEAVCTEMASGHNRKQRTTAEVAQKILSGGWKGRKGRATMDSIRAKVSEFLNNGYGNRTFRKVSRGVYTA